MRKIEAEIQTELRTARLQGAEWLDWVQEQARTAKTNRARICPSIMLETYSTLLE